MLSCALNPYLSFGMASRYSSVYSFARCHSFTNCNFIDSLSCARVVTQKIKKATVKSKMFFNCRLLKSVAEIIEKFLLTFKQREMVAVTFRSWRRPSISFELPTEPHNKYIFIYRRGQHDAGFRQTSCCTPFIYPGIIFSTIASFKMFLPKTKWIFVQRKHNLQAVCVNKVRFCVIIVRFGV